MAHKEKRHKHRNPADFKPGTTKEPFIPARMPPTDHEGDALPPRSILAPAPATKRHRWWHFWQPRQDT